jgi:uncharacterized protein YjiS (DUF1127 family)
MSKMYDPRVFTADRHAAPDLPRAGFWAALAVPLTALLREFRARRDARLLASLDERGLADIGLTHGSVDHVVRHGRRPSDPCPGGAFNRSPVGALPASAWTEWR